jgi:hypothetical protein
LNPSRAASSEALFRQVNERVMEKTEGFASDADAPELFDFLCECAHESCLDHVQLTMGEYEHVRADPTHFVLVPGHELPEAEIVRTENGRFVVVEKIVEEAMLERTDPRS